MTGAPFYFLAAFRETQRCSRLLGVRYWAAIMAGCASLAGGATGIHVAQAQPAAEATEPGADDAAATATEPGAGDEAAPAADEADESVDPETASRAEAKKLFGRGNELRKVGDYQGAFEHYTRSLHVMGTVSGTLNAAYCLYQLERYDEALELYELALTQYESVLSPQQRKQIGPMIRSLRARVGSLDVSANVDGRLVIDGRDRGTLPLVRAVRTLPGLRRVRVIKDGYETWEREVTMVERDTVVLDARLKPLAAAGRVIVEAPGTKGAALVVDGAMVGTLPFDGRLAPGQHVMWIERGTEGTAPQAITVTQGRTIRFTPKLVALGPSFRVVAQPPSAEILVDGVLLGRGAWQGRLPVGRHAVSLRAEGYKVLKRDLDVKTFAAPSLDTELEADPNHPRWGGGQPSGLEQATDTLALQVASTYRPMQSGDFDKIAVMPFREVGPSAEQKRLGAVTAELVRTQLVDEYAVPVAEVGDESTAAEFFEAALAEHVEMKEAARMLNELGAPAVVTGSVTEVGDAYVLHVRLIDLRSGSIVASTYVKVQRDDLTTLADEAIVRKTKIGAVYRSAIPGGGQFYNGREHYLKGAIIGIGTLAGAATAVTLFEVASGQNQKALDIDNSPDCPHTSSTDPAQYEACRADIQDHLDRRDRYRAVGIGAAGVAGALYVWGIIDAAIYGRNYEDIDLSRTEMAERRGTRRVGWHRLHPQLGASPAVGPAWGGHATVTVRF